MGKTATARARLEPEVKEEAEKILDECGLSVSEAIGLFYRQVILHHGLPFQVQSFNEETRRVLRNSEAGVGVTRFESTEDLFEELKEVRERVQRKYGDMDVADIDREISEALSTLGTADQHRVLAYARALARTAPRGAPGTSLLEHSGALAAADADEMSRLIEEDCERVNPDAW